MSGCRVRSRHCRLMLYRFPVHRARSAGRDDDEDALGQSAQFQLADEQAGHDRFAGSGVIGEQETHPRRFQEVVIDSLQLVGERIDAGDGEAEEGIELVGDSKRVSLEPEAQQAAVGLECLCAVD